MPHSVPSASRPPGSGSVIASPDPRVRHALDCIQEAQNLLAEACRTICSVPGYDSGGFEKTPYGRLCKLHDTVKAEWHRLEQFRPRAPRGLVGAGALCSTSNPGGGGGTAAAAAAFAARLWNRSVAAL